MTSIVVPWKPKPSFICTLNAPPRALSPKAGLLLMTSIERTATVGMRSQLTESPKASLMRTPF